MLKIKRIYDTVEEDDGYRVLVDRIWPRGMSKDKAAVDEWLKDVAPSNELRRWFSHDPARYPEFAKRYLQELTDDSHQAAFQHLEKLAMKNSQLTMVYSAKDTEHNQAVVLKERLERENG
ncbi:DUF488 domain-containing protein [Enterococcus sp. AZ109]|uniref:DUF488 domain-containing protein n=1 Tax=Enterococcus sp. AZ109 TaxID=2774634 RepID=UPI003F292BB2